MKRLVIVVPGFSKQTASPKWMTLKAKLLLEEGYQPHQASWLALDHGLNLGSWKKLRSVAKRLRAKVDAQWLLQGGYDEIVLIGHSLGGILVREIYLLAAGAVSGEEKSPWSERVVRFVLLASLNRGIDPQRVRWLKPFTWLGRNVPSVMRFTGFETIRGSAFLTNLRINWIRHFGTLIERSERGDTWSDGSIIQIPCVIQILGTSDGLVSPDDSKDVLALQRGFTLTVPEANHRDLFDIDAAEDPDSRWAVLRRGFCDSFAIAASPRPLEVNGVRRVIFLLHGIRASNVDDWIREIGKAIILRDPEAVVKHPTYGYFTAARFAIPSVRRKKIALFQDWYTEVLAEHPTAEFSILAHSNGTYILGQSLRTTPCMRFENVLLAGSVLPTNFWQELGYSHKHNIGRIRNDRADRDWPVALLCSSLRGLFQRDVGTAGFSGFDGSVVHEVAYYRGGHGEALKPAYHNSVVDYLFGGSAPIEDHLNTSPGYFRQLSNLSPYAAFIVTTALIAGIFWFVLGSPWPFGWTSTGRAVIALGAMLTLYIAAEIA